MTDADHSLEKNFTILSRMLNVYSAVGPEAVQLILEHGVPSSQLIQQW
jgi:hypothetical protein